MHAGRIDGREEGQVAIIARMNATLFEEMVKTVRSGKPLRLGFAGVSNYRIDIICLYKLALLCNKRAKVVQMILFIKAYNA